MKKWNEIVLENKYDDFKQLIKKHNIKMIRDTDEEKQKLQLVLNKLQKEIEQNVSKLKNIKNKKIFDQVIEQIRELEEKEFVYGWMIDFARSFKKRDFSKIENKFYTTDEDPVSILFN